MPARSRLRDIRISTVLNAPPERVYRAFTSARELCVWWVDRAETDARNMGRLRMVWPAIPGGPRGEDAKGVFVDLEPGKKVAWLWEERSRPSGVPPLVSFFIEKKKRGCEVTLLHAGFSAAPSRARVLSRFQERWEDCLAKLRLYLEKGQARKSERLRMSKS